MKVRYDRHVDAAYLELSEGPPLGAVEIDEGVILHLADEDRIVGIEILDVSKKLPAENLFNLGSLHGKRSSGRRSLHTGNSLLDNELSFCYTGFHWPEVFRQGRAP